MLQEVSKENEVRMKSWKALGMEEETESKTIQ